MWAQRLAQWWRGEPPEHLDETTRRLEVLLGLTRLGRERVLSDVLDAVAAAVRETLGYRTFVVNVYRPAWDDYEAVVVHGSEATRRALLHTTNARADFHEELLASAYERIPGAFFIPAEAAAAWNRVGRSYTPPYPVPAHADAWHPKDALLIELRSTTGAPLAILSVDEPESGLRPTDQELRLLVACSAHVAFALETAEAAERQRRHTRALTELLGLSSRLSAGATCAEAGEAIRDAALVTLDFDRAALFLRNEQQLESLAAGGWDERTVIPPLDVAAVEALVGDVDGVRLLDRETLQTTPLWLEAARRNGVGPLAWRGHALLAPLRDGDRRLLGLLVVEEPADRLQPGWERRKELALLAEQAGAVLGRWARL